MNSGLVISVKTGAGIRAAEAAGTWIPVRASLGRNDELGRVGPTAGLLESSIGND